MEYNIIRIQSIYDHLLHMDTDKYIRMMIRVILLREYVMTGDVRYNKAMSLSYSRKDLLPLIYNSGDYTSQLFLAYTILRKVYPDQGWSIFISNDCEVFLMSNDRYIVTYSSLSRISNIVGNGRYMPLCNIEQIRQCSKGIPIVSSSYVPPLLQYKAEREIADIVPPYYIEQARRLLSQKVNIVAESMKMEMRHDTRIMMMNYAYKYRMFKALDVILTNIPPSICKRYTPSMSINRGMLDVDILTV